MKKMLVLMLVLGMASIVSASPVMKLGDATAAFGTGSSTVTVSTGGTYDLYVWASSDVALEYDSDEVVIPSSGLDAIQVFLQYNTANVNLTGGLVTNLRAVAGNPYGTTWTGRSQGDWNGLRFAEGALLPANVDAFSLQQIMRISLTIANPGAMTTVSMLKNQTATHDSFQANSIAGSDYEAVVGSMTFLPEPTTIALLGLGGLALLRRRK